MLDVIDRNVRVPEGVCLAVNCPCGSVVEHSLGKGEVAGPIPAMGTKFLGFRQFWSIL